MTDPSAAFSPPAETDLRPRIPPGQILTRSWPVLHAGSVPRQLSESNYTLRLHGAVANPQTLTYAELRSLPATEITCDIHCVTSWSKLGMRWSGVRFREIDARAKPDPSVRFVIFECEQGFTTSLPREALLDDDVLVAYGVEGGPIPAEHGGPVRMLVPRRYFYKSAKWLRGLRFVAEDEPGFWEVRGYSNIADPWLETRYDVDDRRAIAAMRKRTLFRPLPDAGAEATAPEAQPR
ncbi:MAG: sulfite oxidase-like oxidoreductase [Thermoplasmata archaeon]